MGHSGPKSDYYRSRRNCLRLYCAVLPYIIYVRKPTYIEVKEGVCAMERTQDNPPVCRSIFMSGSSTTSAAFTRKWVELINTLEKDNANKTFRT